VWEYQSARAATVRRTAEVIVDVNYDDLADDPIATIRRVAGQLSLDLDVNPTRIPDSHELRPSPYRWDVADFGVTAAEVRQRLTVYRVWRMPT
jgi:hypothetical protein